MSAYRDAPPGPLACPRCSKPLPPLEVAACTHACGTWVSALVAGEVLTEVDRRPDPVTRWWRVRAPCPVCTDKMRLFGEDPGLLQGCAIHGYFVDGDTVVHTGLARGVDLTSLAEMIESPALNAERARLRALEAEHDRERADQPRQREQAARERAAVDAAAAKQAFTDKLTSALYFPTSPGNAEFLAEQLVALIGRVVELEARIRMLEASR